MKLADVLGYELHLPTSGGKAGKGRQVTSSLQIRRNNRILKQFRFRMEDRESRVRAMRKARLWIEKEVTPNDVQQVRDELQREVKTVS